MPEGTRNHTGFYRWLTRFSFLLLLTGFVFLILTLASLISRLQNLAPVELRLLLEIIKNRFFR